MVVLADLILSLQFFQIMSAIFCGDVLQCCVLLVRYPVLFMQHNNFMIKFV